MKIGPFTFGEKEEKPIDWRIPTSTGPVVQEYQGVNYKTEVWYRRPDGELGKANLCKDGNYREGRTVIDPASTESPDY